MTVTVASFRSDFPEFADATAFPDGGITFWLTVGVSLINACRFQDLTDLATELFIAHNIALERQAAKSAATGAVPGLSTGPVSSKTVGPVTQAYDTSAGLEENAGSFNLTTYGQRLWQLIQMFGAGVIQV